MDYVVDKFKVVNHGGLRAFVSIIIEGKWLIHGFKVIETEKDGKIETWVGRPSRKQGSKWEDIVIPLDQIEIGKLNALILDEYDKIMEAATKGE